MNTAFETNDVLCWLIDFNKNKKTINQLHFHTQRATREGNLENSLIYNFIKKNETHRSNFTQEVCLKHVKTLMTETQGDTRRWKNPLCSAMGRTDAVKIPILPKAIYTVSTVTPKLPEAFSHRTNNPKVVWTQEGPRQQENHDCRRPEEPQEPNATPTSSADPELRRGPLQPPAGPQVTRHTPTETSVFLQRALPQWGPVNADPLSTPSQAASPHLLFLWRVPRRLLSAWTGAHIPPQRVLRGPGLLSALMETHVFQKPPQRVLRKRGSCWHARHPMTSQSLHKGS